MEMEGKKTRKVNARQSSVIQNKFLTHSFFAELSKTFKSPFLPKRRSFNVFPCLPLNNLFMITISKSTIDSIHEGRWEKSMIWSPCIWICGKLQITHSLFVRYVCSFLNSRKSLFGCQTSSTCSSSSPNSLLSRSLECGYGGARLAINVWYWYSFLAGRICRFAFLSPALSGKEFMSINTKVYILNDHFIVIGNNPVIFCKTKVHPFHSSFSSIGRSSYSHLLAMGDHFEYPFSLSGFWRNRLLSHWWTSVYF